MSDDIANIVGNEEKVGAMPPNWMSILWCARSVYLTAYKLKNSHKNV